MWNSLVRCSLLLLLVSGCKNLPEQYPPSPPGWVPLLAPAPLRAEGEHAVPLASIEWRTVDPALGIVEVDTNLTVEVPYRYEFTNGVPDNGSRWMRLSFQATTNKLYQAQAKFGQFAWFARGESFTVPFDMEATQWFEVWTNEPAIFFRVMSN